MRYRLRTDGLVHERIDDQVVIVNLESGSYFTVAGSGSEIWPWIEAGSEIVSRAVATFDGPEATIRGDVERFLSALETAGVVEPLATSERADEVVDAPPSRLPFVRPELVEYTDIQDMLLMDPVHEVDPRGWPHAVPEPPTSDRARTE